MELRPAMWYVGFILILSATALAQGPRVIAIGDRNLWPEPVNSQSGFDKASRAAILAYTQALQDQRDAEAKRPGRSSVLKWLDKELALTVSNYRLAAKSCAGADWTCAGNITGPADLSARAGKIAVSPNLLRWKVNMDSFVRDYIDEQVRLAALFPRTTSEIELFDSNEFNGDRLADRMFFLTFDDGPTPAGGSTDSLLRMLRDKNRTAVFFLLGGNLRGRLRETGAAKLAEIYDGQCIGSHGWQHRSHASAAVWSDGRTWQTSVTDTLALLRSTFKGGEEVTPLFRPPYGERRADSGIFFQQHNLHVALWNLDSQDWNPKLNSDDVTNRIETLMLIKRRGILLFHDIFPKAKTAVPAIIDDFAAAIDWGDCRKISVAF